MCVLTFFLPLSNSSDNVKLPSNGRGATKISDANPKSDLDWTIYRSKQTPGPAAYNVQTNLAKMGGGKFNLSNPKSEIEWIQKRSRETPGPSDYADFSLKDASQRASGGKISTAKPKSQTELLMIRAAETPGPNQCKFSIFALPFSGTCVF